MRLIAEEGPIGQVARPHVQLGKAAGQARSGLGVRMTNSWTVSGIAKMLLGRKPGREGI